jgi:hypothetical protein
MQDVEILNGETTALATIDRSGSMPVMTMRDATERFKMLEAFATQVMTPDIDYGTIPGTNKPTLLKPGAEKLCTFFGLAVEHKLADKTEDWAGGFFYYRYQCSIYRDGVCIATSEGSCNSKEKKYRWRTVFENEATAEDRKVGRREERTAKSGKKYAVYVIENREPFDLVNTLQKMAQKRAHIAATLIAVGASQFFTQDMEDMAQRAHDDTPADAVLATLDRPAPQSAPQHSAPPPQSAPQQRVEDYGQAVETALHEPVATAAAPDGFDWRSVEITFGKHKGKTLADVDAGYIHWLRDNWQPKPKNDGTLWPDAVALQQGIAAYYAEREESIGDPPPGDGEREIDDDGMPF